MKTRTMMYFLALALSFLVMAGCNGTDGQNNEVGQQDPPSSEEETPEQVELTVHATMGGYTEEFMDEHFGAYIREEFPHITLNYLPVRTSGGNVGLQEYIVAGEKIDILISSAIGPLLDLDLQLDLTDMIDEHNFDLESLNPEVVEMQQQLADGGIYGLPYLMNTLVLFYNKDLFDRFGVPYPTNESTWDEIYSAVERLSRVDENVNYRGLTGTYWHMYLMNQLSVAGQYPDTSKARYLEEDYKSEMEFLTRFFQVPGNTWSDSVSVSLMVNEFVEGTSAMYIGLDNTWQLYEFPSEMNWDMIRLPERTENPGVGPQPYPFYMYVTSMSEHPDSAFEAVASFASEKFQEQFVRSGYLPIMQDGPEMMSEYSDDLPEFTDKNKDILWPTLASPVEASPYQPIDRQYTQVIFREVVLGEKDINTALREAAEAHDRELELQMAN